MKRTKESLQEKRIQRSEKFYNKWKQEAYKGIPKLVTRKNAEKVREKVEERLKKEYKKEEKLFKELYELEKQGKHEEVAKRVFEYDEVLARISALHELLDEIYNLTGLQKRQAKQK